MKFYLSHAIRGKAGVKAGHDIQNANCAAAIKIANKLRERFGPKLVLYVPAENETFVQIAYDTGHLAEKEILDIDCKIIDGCDGVIVYVPEGDELQGGRLVEFKHAMRTNKPVIRFSDVEQITFWLQNQFLRA